MSSPTRYQLARANNNEEIAYIISGTTTYDTTGPLLSGGSTTVTKGFRSGSITGGDIVHYGYIGAYITTDVTVISGTPIFSIEVEGKDTTSGKYYNIISGANIEAVGTHVLSFSPSYPSGTVVVNSQLTQYSRTIPKVWRIRVVQTADTDAAIYTVGVAPIVR